MTTHEHTHRRTGFSMIEMMVAMAITIAIVLFFNQVIGAIQSGVGAGVGLSAVIENARTINEQLLLDASSILPASGNGVLVIVNKTVSAKIGEDDPAVANRRADQIMFIRSKGDAESMTPSSNTGFAGGGYAMEPFIKVCYGHGLHTDASGNVAATSLGAAGTADQYASQWLLTRHAMFFCQDPSGNNAEGAWYDAPITGYGTDDPAYTQFVYMSTCDVAELGFMSVDPTNGAMMGGVAAAATGPNVAKRLLLDDTAATYASKALNYTFAHQRVRVNTQPATSLESWRMAQMHTLLAENVVEFAVAFAGDYNNDGVVDTLTGNVIKWYENNLAGGPTAGAAAPLPIYAAGGAPEADHVYVFRHGSGDTRWPQMIRVRYRVSDPLGKLTAPDGGAGRIFEQIIRIPN